MSFLRSLRKFFDSSSTTINGLINSSEDIMRSLQRIVDEGESGSFLIIDCDGNRYIQFARNKENNILECEATGNENLKEEYKLTEDKIAMLKSFGWNEPNDSSSNFHRKIAIDDKTDLIETLELILKTFHDIYQIKGEEVLNYTLHLEGVSP